MAQVWVQGPISEVNSNTIDPRLVYFCHLLFIDVLTNLKIYLTLCRSDFKINTIPITGIKAMSTIHRWFYARPIKNTLLVYSEW
jgi:hypothetical protein